MIPIQLILFVEMMMFFHYQKEREREKKKNQSVHFEKQRFKLDPKKKNPL